MNSDSDQHTDINENDNESMGWNKLTQHNKDIIQQ